MCSTSSPGYADRSLISTQGVNFHVKKKKEDERESGARADYKVSAVVCGRLYVGLHQRLFLGRPLRQQQSLTLTSNV